MRQSVLAHVTIDVPHPGYRFLGQGCSWSIWPTWWLNIFGWEPYNLHGRSGKPLPARVGCARTIYTYRAQRLIAAEARICL